jgi:hypothetical protein
LLLLPLALVMLLVLRRRLLLAVCDMGHGPWCQQLRLQDCG